MCGICGIWGNGKKEVVSSMVKALHHRGPDDSGIFGDEKVTIGMARLAIIDVSSAGHQPMSTPDQMIWIVYNGEVYNYRQEREHLKKLGYQFFSNSDTEVILFLYQHYGDEFLLRLRGIFALAIYDKRNGPGKERLLLARDHFGIKPLLYSETGGKFIFASEIKALLDSGLVNPDIDPDALRLLLTFGSVYQPHTILKNVKMLLPGHRLIIENGKKNIEKYWSLKTNRYPELRKLSYPEQVSILYDALAESVQLQMVSDVPLGAFLSGGVDSSILVALMTKVAGSRIKTYSVGFESEGASIDESGDALKTANYLGTDHTHVMVSGKEVRDQIFDIATALDQPSVDGVNSYFVSSAAKKGVTVAISGTGGDELFAGYPWFLNMVNEQHSQIPSWIRALNSLSLLPIFDDFPLEWARKRINIVRTLSGFLNRYSLQYQIFGSGGTTRLLSDDLKNRASTGRAEYYTLKEIDELEKDSVVQRVSGLCLRGYTANQLLRDIDAVSMSHSLEVRVPYLDPVLTDIALSLPDETKLNLQNSKTGEHKTYRSTGAKRILIDAGRKLLPENFDVQPKRGFAMPFGNWLNDPLRDILMQTLSENSVKNRGWLNSLETLKIREDFFNGKIDWSKPWLLMMIELWASQVLDNSKKNDYPDL